MTAQPPVLVQPEPGSRLDQLAATYDAAKVEAAAAADRLKTITDAIKAELATAAPDQPKVDLVHPALGLPLRLSARTSWRLDTAKLKFARPEVYAAFARQSTTWELRAVSDHERG